jgi:hypothetical protein
MDRFAVLVFHDQRIDDAQQLAFSRDFGTLEQATYGVRSTLSPRRVIAFGIRTVRNNLKRLRRPPEGAPRKPQRRRLGIEIEDTRTSTATARDGGGTIPAVY